MGKTDFLTDEREMLFSIPIGFKERLMSEELNHDTAKTPHIDYRRICGIFEDELWSSIPSGNNIISKWDILRTLKKPR